MTNQRVERDTYDAHIVPAETAARIEREGENYKHTPEHQDFQDVDTNAGFTVDQEGLLNNYAVEPEMYYETPGDARAQEEAETQARQQELHEINNTNEEGKLDSTHDERSKGTGVI